MSEEPHCLHVTPGIPSDLVKRRTVTPLRPGGTTHWMTGFTIVHRLGVLFQAFKSHFLIGRSAGFQQIRAVPGNLKACTRLSHQRLLRHPEGPIIRD